jgi:hypothetical protein
MTIPGASSSTQKPTLKQSLLQMLFGAVVGGVGMMVVLWVVRLPRFDLPLAGWVLVVLACAAALFVATAVHEVGHIVAAKMADFRPHLFIVGPLRLERRGESWIAGVNRAFPWWGGFAGAVPNHTERLRERMIGLIAGGPGASVATGVLALGALAAAGFDRTDRLAGADAATYIWTFFFGLVSLFMGFVALVPGAGHGFATDGARILRFLQKGPDADGEVAVLTLVGLSMGGQRPREWPQTLIGQAQLLAADSPTGAAARFLAHLHALDSGDEAAARRLLADVQANREVLPRMSRPALALSAAYFAAVHDGNAIAARHEFEQAGEGVLLAAHSRPLTEAAVLIAEGRAAAALALLDAAERELPSATDLGSARMAADQIQRLRGLARST